MSRIQNQRQERRGWLNAVSAFLGTRNMLSTKGGCIWETDVFGKVDAQERMSVAEGGQNLERFPELEIWCQSKGPPEHGYGDTGTFGKVDV